MACLTLDILNAIEASRDLDGIERPTTIENPPETDHPEAGSAFYLPEVCRWTEREHTEFAGSIGGPRGSTQSSPTLTPASTGSGSHVYVQVPPWLQAPRRGLHELGSLGALPRRPLYAKLLWLFGRRAQRRRLPTLRGGGKYGSLRKETSKKAIRDEENKAAVGGLRRPA